MMQFYEFMNIMILKHATILDYYKIKFSEK